MKILTYFYVPVIKFARCVPVFLRELKFTATLTFKIQYKKKNVF